MLAAAAPAALAQDGATPAACRTACDCEPGLGCFDGQCIAGFAPVFCCDSRPCPEAAQCQHRDGAMSTCGGSCTSETWACDASGVAPACRPGYRCQCVSSCEGCDDCPHTACVPDRCVPRDAPTCEERLAGMLRKTRRLVARTNRCESAEQCVHADTTTGCQGSCGAWINRMYVEPFARSLERFDARICGGYQEDGCPYATPGCIAETGACVRGRCHGSPD